MTADNDQVVASRPRRKLKPRKQWKKYYRPGEGELLTEAELARPLGETPRTIRNWRHKGIIPYLVLGHRSIRYRLDAVLAALGKREIKAAKGGWQMNDPESARQKRRIEYLQAKIAKNLTPEEQDELTHLLQQPVTILSTPKLTEAQVAEMFEEQGPEEMAEKLETYRTEVENLKRAEQLMRKVVGYGKK
jgi:hypothetical protein